MGHEANPEHLNMLMKGKHSWNEWRKEHTEVAPMLCGADLNGADLIGANLSGAILNKAQLDDAQLSGATLTHASMSEANLYHARLDEADLRKAIIHRGNLWNADLSRANLEGAQLNKANLYHAKLVRSVLRGADFYGADLTEATLMGADLTRAKLLEAHMIRCNLTDANLTEASLIRAGMQSAVLTGADLTDADLYEASLLQANLENATLNRCRVHGVSAWGLKLEGARQSDLLITAPDEPDITVDEIDVAQFIYLLLNNKKIRNVIDTITSKVVLILGRFTAERKLVLDALRNEIRTRNLSPVVFDFDIPQSRDITETVTLLARMARFVVADLTDPRSIPQEIQAIAPEVAVPIQPIILAGQEPWSMFNDLRRKYHWVLVPYKYTDKQDLLTKLGDVLAAAEAKRKELSGR